MTERFDTEKWNTFENSGRVSDYLSFKGLGSSRLPVKKEVTRIADNNGGSGNIRQGYGGQ